MRLNRRVLTAALAVAVCATSSQLPGTSVHAAPTGSSANNATSTTAAATTYTVANGDSLWTISLKLKVPFPALLAANKLTATSVILAGQQLVVPAGSTPATPSTPSTTVPAKPATTKPTSTKGAAGAPASTTPPTTARPAVPANTTAPTNYTIVNGDYLYGIAFNYGVSFNALLAANKFTITSAIHPGMVIIIPAGALTTPKTTAAKLAAAPAANATTGIGTTATATSTVTTVPPAAAAPHVTIAPTGNSKLDAVLAFALAQIGKPYVFAGAGPDSYDCSGLVLAAYAQAGIQLIHQSAFQATEGTAVDWTTAPILPGDLVFTAGSATPGMISHVGMAINSTQWIQAPKPGSSVGIGSLPATEKILAVRRFITV